jgi:hypothetical protein
MKEHFILQFKMLNRQLTEWGIEPIIGYFVASVAFLGVSIKLFENRNMLNISTLQLF